jgi:hypothetical protein
MVAGYRSVTFADPVNAERRTPVPWHAMSEADGNEPGAAVR